MNIKIKEALESGIENIELLMDRFSDEDADFGAKQALEADLTKMREALAGLDGFCEWRENATGQWNAACGLYRKEGMCSRCGKQQISIKFKK